MGDDLRALGEIGLLRRLLDRLPAADVVVGPGDDAAVLEWRDGRALLATADILVEGRHFDLAFSSPRDVGFKAVAVNVSDIAAMGGRPRYALVSLGVDAATGAAALESLYDGIADAARAFDLGVAGGDTVGADALVVSVAVLGDTSAPVLRSGAGPGDALCVTGVLGAAAAGLALLRAAATDPTARDLLDGFPGLAEAHRRGRARVAEGQAAGAAGARAMIDVSDGLGRDASCLCEASRCGAVIEAAALPLAPGVAEVAAWLGRAPAAVALHGGDDYELAMAVPVDQVEAVAAAVGPTPLAVVGRFTDGDRALLDDGTDLATAGWDHFA